MMFARHPGTEPAMHLDAPDQPRLRDTLGTFATGVTVVTCRAPNGEPLGFTANSFNSVSLEPPLVLVSLDRNLRSLPGFLAAPYFAVNVLAASQREVSDRFAQRGTDKWTATLTKASRSGTPLIVDSLAVFDCARWAAYNGGDHVILVGRVMGLAHEPDAAPLLFFRGTYCQLNERAG
jgi:flavin reductase (DIM6/NTAB) family NADH-FMN oxidoreductase RutF